MNRALIVAAFLILIAGAYVVVKKTQGHLTPSAGPTPSQVAVDSVRIKEGTSTYTIDATYPQFGIAAIDADIKAKVESALAEFKVLPPNPPESATPKNEFTGTFEDVYIGPDIISLKLVLSQYTGGAHPMTIFSGVNYDRATGRQILQQDAFALIGMTVQEVSAKASAELTSKLGDSFFPEGANSNSENFSSFLISKDQVTFIFQPYQVAPYAAGPQEVSLPRASAAVSARQRTDCQAACNRRCGANADCVTECYANCRADSR